MWVGVLHILGDVFTVFYCLFLNIYIVLVAFN